MARGFGIVWKAIVFGATPVLLVAWCNRPLDPDAWRELSRTATDAELRAQLPSDEDGRAEARWHQYLRALARGDDEALRVAGRICEGLGAHPGEAFVSALSWNLEREPARVFELERRCLPPGLVCDSWFEDEYLDPPPDALAQKASIEKRREAVLALLDGGWSAEASTCLARLRD